MVSSCLVCRTERAGYSLGCCLIRGGATVLCHLTGQTSLASSLLAAPFPSLRCVSPPLHFLSSLSPGFPPLFPELCSMLSVKEAPIESLHNSCLRSGSQRANTMAQQEKALAWQTAGQLSPWNPHGRSRGLASVS